QHGSKTRGSLIIRQLCLNLSTERIYKAFAEIIEKDKDLDFASVIVQKLSMILVTSPELADFRRRLKSLETQKDSQALFVTLYQLWCHNPVAVFSLCLLAQAYEHAFNLLGILQVFFLLSDINVAYSRTQRQP
ncbi:vacuolar protein 14 C-terminal Fig4-binding domain-containing protein, partial [Lactarius vividus]